jgi:multimeric flavodoxin WrbA
MAAVLLVVHHTTSPSMQEMLESVLAGTKAEGITDVDVRVRPALAATAIDVMDADAFVLGTPVNIGYISGALKHFFDQIYYPCLVSNTNAGFGAYLHGNNDATGAVRAIASITTGLGWREVHTPVVAKGTLTRQHLDECWDLGATAAATLMA